MDNLQCSICNGTLNLLGVLGSREHYNCQNCGAESSWDMSKAVFSNTLKKEEEENEQNKNRNN